MTRKDARHMILTALTRVTTATGAVIAGIEVKASDEETAKRIAVVEESVREFTWICEQVKRAELK